MWFLGSNVLINIINMLSFVVFTSPSKDSHSGWQSYHHDVPTTVLEGNAHGWLSEAQVNSLQYTQTQPPRLMEETKHTSKVPLL